MTVISLVLTGVALWGISGVFIPFCIPSIPYFGRYRKPVLMAFILPAFLVLVATGIFTLVLRADWVVFTLSGGIYFLQSVLAYVLSYYKLDNCEKYPAPYGYFHTHNFLFIPELEIVESEVRRSTIDNYLGNLRKDYLGK